MAARLGCAGVCVTCRELRRYSEEAALSAEAELDRAGMQIDQALLRLRKVRGRLVDAIAALEARRGRVARVVQLPPDRSSDTTTR